MRPVREKCARNKSLRSVTLNRDLNCVERNTGNRGVSRVVSVDAAKHLAVKSRRQRGRDRVL